MAEKNQVTDQFNTQDLSFDDFKKVVINDYRIAVESREASLLGRKEVLTGKAKFGIFGDGKEIAQIAMAKAFRKGDFRAGYYRDQTFMFATGMSDIQEFFAQLYAHADISAEPNSAGRQMNAHFGTRSLNKDGTWKNLTEMYNSSADGSPTASQMPRMLGLAYASKLYRQNKGLKELKSFSINGNEVAFGTIGDSSTSEGIFWETINAAGVLQVPLALSVWDDGFGISVSKKYQTTKESISTILKGFQQDEDGDGFQIYTAKGWDYPGLCEMYEEGIKLVREKHIPALFHIQEVTQPQGHSTSGSHERYKSRERLQWEIDFDGIKKMRDWMIKSAIVEEKELGEIEKNAIAHVKNAKTAAWNAYLQPIKDETKEALRLIEAVSSQSSNVNFINKIKNDLAAINEPFRKDSMIAVNQVLKYSRNENFPAKSDLLNWYKKAKYDNQDRYSSHLSSETEDSALNVIIVDPVFDDNSPVIDGWEIMNACFDAAFERDPKVVAFGEDLGKIGDVNQGFRGLQEKYGENRVTDTGIRETTIIGQGIGLAMRGLRPIAEIQYLDYLLYAFQTLSDDLATLRYRTKGGQKAPLIIRTRGHRLEGIWHTGSPMGMIMGALRGIHILVPRNMTQTAGFYNTMLRSDDPALIIECLNGYRLKERLPNNIGEFTLPLGVPETLEEGSDVTLVTYGSCVRIAQEAMKQLNETGVSVELIDVQSLLPFDINHHIVESLKNTNKIVFLDEDVPGGASAFMMKEVLETQNGYSYLDAAPKTITAKPHRSAYGTDGDYFSKPNVEDVFQGIYQLMHEYCPEKYPSIID